MKDLGRAAGAAAVALVLSLAPAGAAGEGEGPAAGISLAEALERTIASSHLVKAARHDEEKAEVSVKRARAERYVPEAELLVETGVVPAAKGTVIDSPDEDDDLDDLGGFYKVNLKVVQPLYTFGRLSNLEQAALEGLDAQQAKTALTLQELTQLVVRTWWSLAAASRALDVAGELRENFYKLQEEVQTRLEDEASEVDDGDLLEVKSSTFRIEKIYRDAREDHRRATVALSVLMGTDDRDLAAAEQESPALPLAVEEFETLLAERGVSHKQIDAVEAASRALAAKIELLRSDRYPLVFLAAGAGYAEAPNRTDQTNPFVVDDYNYAKLGAEIGIAWKPNIYKKNLEVEEVEKEYRSLLENLQALRQKLTVEASEKFGEAAKNRDLLDAARTSLDASRSWLRLSVDNWDIGLGEVKRLLDAYEAYYEMKGVEIQMELEYNLSLIRVAAAFGDVNLYLRWLEDGTVQF